MILKDSKSIFIHIPKTAGGTVEMRLGRYFYGEHWSELRKSHLSVDGEWSQHFTYLEYTKKYPELNFPDMYKFVFVRNPWDRAVSEYMYVKKMKGCKCEEKHIPENFQIYIKEGGTCSWENHVRPQKDFIVDRRGRVVVDDIFKFEHFEKNFKKLLRILKIRDMPEESFKFRANVSRRPREKKKMPYWMFYDKETKELVYDMYSSDVTLFNYDFRED